MKVVLSNGNEFDLVSNVVEPDPSLIFISFASGDNTMEHILNVFTGNDTIKVKDNNVSLKVYIGFNKCKSVTLEPNQHIKTVFVCPECGADSEYGKTKCDSCNKEFDEDGPISKEIYGNVCTVICSKSNIEDISDRLKDLEETIENLVTASLAAE